MKWIMEEYILEAIKMADKMPFEIRGDIGRNQYQCYPTHTRGLHLQQLPEIFINASAFGPVDNASMINIVATGLLLNKELRDIFMEKGILELKTGTHEEDVDITMCLRKVENNFLGVLKAYPECTPSGFGYAQLYVKGDDHVLKEEFFIQIP